MGWPVLAPKNKVYMGKASAIVGHCIADVAYGKYTSGQCERDAGHGPDNLFCRQHANKIEKDGLQYFD